LSFSGPHTFGFDLSTLSPGGKNFQLFFFSANALAFACVYKAVGAQTSASTNTLLNTGSYTCNDRLT
jgi:hypothetical protein